MSQHHLPIEHFLTKLNTEEQDRSAGKKEIRPEWLTHFIDSIADLFDPLIGVARVGFDCNFVEGSWVVGLYLGSYEIVGGRHDGEARHINFEFDLQQLMAHFSKVSELVWTRSPRRAIRGRRGHAATSRSPASLPSNPSACKSSASRRCMPTLGCAAIRMDGLNRRSRRTHTMQSEACKAQTATQSFCTLPSALFTLHFPHGAVVAVKKRSHHPIRRPSVAATGSELFKLVVDRFVDRLAIEGCVDRIQYGDHV